MTDPTRDAELEAWLARSSPLHERLARLDRMDPQEDLDRAVLDRAREALRSPRPVASNRRMAWAVPVGLAATLVLSFVLLVQIGPWRADPQPAADVHGASRDEIAADRMRSAPSAEQAMPDLREFPASQEPKPKTAAAPRMPPQRVSQPRQKAEVPLERGQALAVESAAQADRRRVPEVWLAEIERLRAQGLHDEAERELSEFRRAYPAHGIGRATAEPSDGAATRPAATPPDHR